MEADDEEVYSDLDFQEEESKVVASAAAPLSAKPRKEAQQQLIDDIADDE